MTIYRGYDIIVPVFPPLPGYAIGKPGQNPIEYGFKSEDDAMAAIDKLKKEEAAKKSA